MKKQLVSALLVLTMAMSLVGCGKKDSGEAADTTIDVEMEEQEAPVQLCLQFQF